MNRSRYMLIGPEDDERESCNGCNRVVGWYFEHGPDCPVHEEEMAEAQACQREQMTLDLEDYRR